MILLRTRHWMAMAAVSWLAAGTVTAGQDTLARAKDLYAQAAYDEALVVLARLHSSASGDEATEVAGYQVFCLLALGRADEAQRAIEALVKADPLYRPSEATASPRTRAIFDEVRRGLLPRIAQELYDQAKAAFDRNEAQLAVTHFDRVLLLLNEPGLTESPGMADLRRLATGFRDLSLAAATTASPSAASAEDPDPVPAVPPPPTYSSDDAGVVPPVSISRSTPPWHPRNTMEARREFQGVLEVVIDEKGDVVSAVLGKSVHPSYDEALLKTAREWKFRPATKDGVPVRYRTSVEIRLRPSGTAQSEPGSGA
jgi:TonB family protein